MKKIFSLLMILGLVFMITGCENFGLSDEAGFGQLLVSEVTLTDATVVNDAVVKIGDVEGTVGELINVPAGTYDVTVTTVINGLNYGATIPGIVIETGKTNIIENTVIDVLSNAWKFTFDPAAYGLDSTNISAVYAAGDWNDWAGSALGDHDPAKYCVPFYYDGNNWTAIIDAPEGAGFKWNIVDDMGNVTWKGDPDSDQNMTVNEANSAISSVLAWKFTFDPADYGLDSTNISAVYAAGDWNDWAGSALGDHDPAKYCVPFYYDGNNWTAIIDAPEGAGFKWNIVDDMGSVTWKGDPDSDQNMTVNEANPYVTLNF